MAELLYVHATIVLVDPESPHMVVNMADLWLSQYVVKLELVTVPEYTVFKAVKIAGLISALDVAAYALSSSTITPHLARDTK